MILILVEDAGLGKIHIVTGQVRIVDAPKGASILQLILRSWRLSQDVWRWKRGCALCRFKLPCLNPVGLADC